MNMVDKTTIIYCIIDDILKAINHQEDKSQKMTDAEVITRVLIACIEFYSNIEKTRKTLKQTGLIPDMLSKSRLNRRIHRLYDLIENLIFQLGEIFKSANTSMEYILDSFPVPVCDNIRIKRSKIVSSEAYRGYIASKKRYFYGIRIHILATSSGLPVEFTFLPGRPHDVNALFELPLYLPQKSTIYADSAYTIYDFEDTLYSVNDINLSPNRKINSNRLDEPLIKWYKSYTRKKIETIFSKITNFFPKKIHAVRIKGFLLKLLCFILGFTLNSAFC